MGKRYDNLLQAAQDGLQFWCRTCGYLYKTLNGAMNHRTTRDHDVISITHLLVRFEQAAPDDPFVGPHPYDGVSPSDAL